MKKIVSLIIVLTMVFSPCICAYASNIKEIINDVTEAQEQRDKQKNDDKAKQSDETKEQVDGEEKKPMFLEPADQLYRLFMDILELYTDRHLYEFTEEEVLRKFIYDMIIAHPEIYEQMLDIMLGTMDKYSSYHSKNSGFLSLDSGSAGYGVVIDEAENGILVKNVLKQSEAEKAGILPGDLIVAVGGIDISKIPSYAVSVLLKRPYIFFTEKDNNGKYTDYNPEISLIIERDGKKMEFILKKGLMVSEELSTDIFEVEGERIAYISISSFVSEDLAKKFKKAIEDFKNQGLGKIIIDLRNNGGGSLELAIEMSEVFVKKGDIMCLYNDKNSEKPREIVSDTDRIEFDTISVLVNEYTASAAELMANILRTRADAVLVGKKTVGKAIGQTSYGLPSGSYITITTYEILDYLGQSYNDIGITPDFILDNVTMLYTLPKLEVFNHINYKEIIGGVYSEPCLALEKRLEILGHLKASEVDGIWNEHTSLAVYILQTTYYSNKGTGSLDDKTVTLITDLINGCKDDTYTNDYQLDCAALYHISPDKAKECIEESVKVSKEQAELIKENNKRLEELAELED